jgi:hypothetical protein
LINRGEAQVLGAPIACTGIRRRGGSSSRSWGQGGRASISSSEGAQAADGLSDEDIEAANASNDENVDTANFPTGRWRRRSVVPGADNSAIIDYIDYFLAIESSMPPQVSV